MQSKKTSNFALFLEMSGKLFFVVHNLPSSGIPCDVKAVSWLSWSK